MIQHFSTKFVTEYEVACQIDQFARAGAAGSIDDLRRVAQNVKIGAADATGERADEDLPLARYGISNLIDNEVAFAEDGGAHRGYPKNGCADIVGYPAFRGKSGYRQTGTRSGKRVHSRHAKFSWEISCNPLIQIAHVFPRLGEKPSNIKSGYWTLNQRAQGSRPGVNTGSL
jgi:hypothetical protein